MNNSGSIHRNQNDIKILCLLKAQSAKYDKAKRLLFWGICPSTIGAITFAILTYFYDSEVLTTLSSFVAIVSYVLVTEIEKRAGSITESAAEIQQAIDVKLFNLPDSCQTLINSDVTEIVAKYRNKNPTDFKNWYSDYSSLTFHKQVLFSQKENIRWDNGLRERYLKIIKFIAVFIPLLLIVYLIIIKASLAITLALASWVFPLEQFLLTQLNGLGGDIDFLEKINAEQRRLESNFDNIGSRNMQCELCNLQNLIFEHRKKAIMIPSFYYKIFKKKTQQNEDSIASESGNSE
jgi:predicted neutral ceramidase superfamily lipid hydrolase